MKVLFDPIFTQFDVRKCSTNYILSRIALDVIERNPDIIVYYPVPVNGDKWDLTGAPSHERLKRIPMWHPLDRYKSYYTLHREWIDKFAFWGEYADWDVMVTVRTPMVAAMRAWIDKGLDNQRRKKIVIFDPLPLLDFKETVSVSNDLRLQTLVGYQLADLVVVNAGHEKKGILEDARELLSFAKVRDLTEKIVVKYVGPKVDKEFPFQKRDLFCNDPKMRVMYTQRMDKTERRPDMVLDSFFYEFVMKNDKVDFQICTNSRIKTETYGGEEKWKPFEIETPDRKSVV